MDICGYCSQTPCVCKITTNYLRCEFGDSNPWGLPAGSWTRTTEELCDNCGETPCDCLINDLVLDLLDIINVSRSYQPIRQQNKLENVLINF